MTAVVPISLPGSGGDLLAPALSRREVEVVVTWLRTRSKEEAAAELFISPTTVSTHLNRIRAKYRAVGRPASSKVALLARAMQDGYITISDL